jgi:hypothetical protein
MLLRMFTEHAAERRDLLVEIVFLYNELGPDRGHQSGLVEELAGMLEEEDECVERSGAQR